MGAGKSLDDMMQLYKQLPIVGDKNACNLSSPNHKQLLGDMICLSDLVAKKKKELGLSERKIVPRNALHLLFIIVESMDNMHCEVHAY